MLATGYSVRCIQSSDASKRRPESFPCELAALRREIACLKQEMSALVNRLEPVTMVPVGICSMQDASDINSFIRDKFVAGSMGVSKTPPGQSPAGSEFAILVSDPRTRLQLLFSIPKGKKVLVPKTMLPKGKKQVPLAITTMRTSL